MARKKPAKKATQKSTARPAARKPAKKTNTKAKAKAVKKARTSAKATAARPKNAAKKAAKKATPNRRAAGFKAAASKKAAATIRKAKRTAAAIKAVGTKKAAVAKSKGRFLTAVKKLATAAAAGVGAAFPPSARASTSAKASSAKATADQPMKKPNLDRPRKTVADVHGIPSSLDLDRSASSAKSGRAEMRDKLSKSNSGGAAITAGDVDADWLSAESVGDEAPGGDNPTPDQDRVDDIGRALGVEYADDEELQGGAEIADRDLNRWELDPASKDDFEDEDN